MSIALLCPTRARPAQCKRMIESVKNTQSGKNKIMGYLAIRDADIRDYEVSESDIVVDDNLPTVHKWNLLARNAKRNRENNLFMLCADDVVFKTDGWDKALLDHYNALENKIHVYALQDSRDPDGTPHPIVTREYMDAMGYFVPPIFMHWYVDSWTVEIAKANWCFTHLKDYLLIHDKPSDKGESDETHHRIRRMGWHERDMYVNDTCKHFLQSEKLKLGHKMTDLHHENYMRSLGEP